MIQLRQSYSFSRYSFPAAHDWEIIKSYFAVSWISSDIVFSVYFQPNKCQIALLILYDEKFGAPDLIICLTVVVRSVVVWVSFDRYVRICHRPFINDQFFNFNRSYHIFYVLYTAAKVYETPRPLSSTTPGILPFLQSMCESIVLCFISSVHRKGHTF